MNKRFKPEVRKDQILDAALKIAGDKGLASLSRQAVADAVGVSGQTINHYFGTLKQLERAVKRAAVARPSYPVICQLIVSNDPIVADMPEKAKRKALRGFV